MKKLHVEDNFLDKDSFQEIQNTMLGTKNTTSFEWYYTDNITLEPGDEDTFQFIHNFYNDGRPICRYFELLKPLLEIMNPLSILRIKANLIPRTSKIVENTLHTDISGILEEKVKQWTISIFYMNTNNGYTKFEDGTKVESVANRLVTFPANIRHTGTTCTDEKKRSVINFNYYRM